MVKTDHISMPNLLAGKEIVPEFVQGQVQPRPMADALMRYFNHPEETQRLTEIYDDIHRTLRGNASHSAAAAIARLLGDGCCQHWRGRFRPTTNARGRRVGTCGGG